MVAPRQYKQGVFKPNHPEKYKGTTPIIYRSGLELLFSRWCDRNDKVVQWGSESVVIPYISPLDGKVHRYFVDYVLSLKVNEEFKKYIVEIKPSKQTQPPTNNSKKKRSTILYEQVEWARNSAKWEAANSWAKKKGWSFVVLTEKDIK
jgi:hypothetical protein